MAADRRLRGAKVRRIVRRELWTTVSRPGWIVSTLAVPLLPLLILGVQLLTDPARLMAGPEPARVALVDESGLLDVDALAEPGPGFELELPAGLPGPEPRADDAYLPYPSDAAARADLLSGRAVCGPTRDHTGGCGPLTGYVRLPEDWAITGRVETYRLEGDDGLTSQPFGLGLARRLRAALLADRLPPELAERALAPVADRVDHRLTAQGEVRPEGLLPEEVRRLIVPLMAGVFLVVALFSGAGYLLLGLSEEKENRVLELLLASVTPDEILAGKLLGIGAAGLLQVALWSLVVAMPLSAAAPLLGLSWSQAAWALAFFLAAYALFGALMLGVGAVADTARHAQQLSGAFTLTAVLPLIFSSLVLQEPLGPLARGLTWFPVTTPVTAMLRLAAAPVPAWDLGLGLGMLILAAWAALWGSARLFRASLLLRGQRPTPATLWRWLRSGG